MKSEAVITLSIVLPGDDVTDNIQQTNEKQPKLGSGLRVYLETGIERVKATRAGRLVQRSNTCYVQQNTQRYLPLTEDRVIGIVEDRVGGDSSGGDIYRVNIGGPHPALLSNLNFEGATKRNKPTLTTGMLVYARVESTPASLDPWISCTLGPQDAGVSRKDWMTNEGTYGILNGGTCQKIPLGLAREILYPNNLVLQELSSKSITFEVCIGVNGFLWIHSTRPEYTILIQNAIMNSQVLTEAQVRGMVKLLVETVNHQIRELDE